MIYNIELLRKKRGEKQTYTERFEYATDDGTETVAYVLARLNKRIEAEGISDRKIRWDCSCMQKKCGACAMLINGSPKLACDTRLSEYKGIIRLEPLRKFPTVEDLVADRSEMLSNLKRLDLWLDDGESPGNKGTEISYEASRCLQCGCCLEVCPNFMPDGGFAGMAGAVPISRLIEEIPKNAKQRKDLDKHYIGEVYEGCGKSLACRNICPAGIDIESLLVNSNAAAVWKRR